MLRGCIQRPSLLAEKHLVFESARFVRWHGGLWLTPTDERYCLPHHACVTRDAAMPETPGRHEPRLGPRRGDRGAVLPADRFITFVVDHEQGRATRHVAGNVAHIQISPAIPNAALRAHAPPPGPRAGQPVREIPRGGGAGPPPPPLPRPFPPRQYDRAPAREEPPRCWGREGAPSRKEQPFGEPCGRTRRHGLQQP